MRFLVVAVIITAFTGEVFGANAAPTIATPAAASPSTVTANSTNLSVLGADDGGEPALTYTWAATAKPAGAADPTYSANGTNASKNTTAVFTSAGSYTLTVTVTDAGALTTTSQVAVTVQQTFSSVTVSPAAGSNYGHVPEQFTAIALDQFGFPMAAQPGFTWSLNGGDPGQVFDNGTYTPPAAGTGVAHVTATSGAKSATVTYTIKDPFSVGILAADYVPGTNAGLGFTVNDDPQSIGQKSILTNSNDLLNTGPLSTVTYHLNFPNAGATNSYTLYIHMRLTRDYYNYDSAWALSPLDANPSQTENGGATTPWDKINNLSVIGGVDTVDPDGTQRPQPYGWVNLDLTKAAALGYDGVAPYVNVTPGVHTFMFGGREPGFVLDAIAFSTDNALDATPEGLAYLNSIAVQGQNFNATVNITGTNVVYDGSAKPVVVSTNPGSLATVVTYNGSGTPPTAPGTYAVIAHVNDAVYSGSATATLTIAPATPALAWAIPADIVVGTALSSVQLNASSPVAGTYVYSPAAGTQLPAGKSQMLRVIFTPSDANYAAVQGSVALNVVNPGPQFTSGVSASPNPVNVGGMVNFSASAGSGVAGGVTCAWNFGDGSQGSGATVTHTYTTQGLYTAVVTVTDALGASAQATVPVAVTNLPAVFTDADGNGIPDEMDAAATAAGIPSADDAAPIRDTKLKVALVFSKSSSDVVQLSATLVADVGFSAAGNTVIVDIAGIVRSFQLDDKGKAKSGGDTIAVASKRGNATLQYVTLKLAPATYSAILQRLNVQRQLTNYQAVEIPLAIMIDSSIWSSVLPGVYTNANRGNKGLVRN